METQGQSVRRQKPRKVALTVGLIIVTGSFQSIGEKAGNAIWSALITIVQGVINYAK